MAEVRRNVCWYADSTEKDVCREGKMVACRRETATASPVSDVFFKKIRKRTYRCRSGCLFALYVHPANAILRSQSRWFESTQSDISDPGKQQPRGQTQWTIGLTPFESRASAPHAFDQLASDPWWQPYWHHWLEPKAQPGYRRRNAWYHRHFEGWVGKELVGGEGLWGQVGHGV